ncbi:HYR domain-containing protein [Reichenbachiella agarivorans]|uniref:HYR domain-containing protein n=1 Tax=Reichenbachiella agarivorans TaxID=2979464 RepID=A0ABY6CTS2_9BACT|nr:HYR domain-containing protein [Reichenbachiella agarivorans]UXP31650.1 HYR domain-containing protein [Reichenbachiella agarivorans]
MNRIPRLIVLALIFLSPFFLQAQCFDVPEPDINGLNGIRLNEINIGDKFGNAVSSAGDINGDGIDDILISAHQAHDLINSVDDVGKVYVVFGQAGLVSPYDLTSLDGSNGFVIRGVKNTDYLGTSISKLGDFNQDGIDDIIIGIPNYIKSTSVKSGAAMILYGKLGAFPSEISYEDLDGSNGFIIEGEAAGDRFGSSVNELGDVNGDGHPDLIVGAPNTTNSSIYAAGSAYVIFGNSSMPAIFNSSDINGSNGSVYKANISSYLMGNAVSTVGDINDDGINDIAISSHSASNGALTYAGLTYVVYGKSSYTPVFELSTVNGSNGFLVRGASQSAYLGLEVGFAGDLNNDGIDDMVIGARGAKVNDKQTGSAYVIFGSTSPTAFPLNYDLTNLDGSNGFVIQGSEQNNDNLGYSVAYAGDINNDGMDDLIIGATYGGRGFVGTSYVLFGKTGGWSSSITANSYINGSNGFQVFNTERFRSLYGASVAGLGDVNGDGNDDFIIGGPSPFASFNGKVTVVYGESMDLIDDIDPAITCPLDKQLFIGSTLPDYTDDVSATDNCTYKENLIITQSPAHGTLFTGTMTVTIHVSDLSGNSSSCDFSVTPNTPNPDRTCASTSLNTSKLNGTDGFLVEGKKTTSNLGSDVNYVGDFNGDGIDDFIVGAPGATASFVGEYSSMSETVSGTAFLVFGRADGFPAYQDMAFLDGTNGFEIGDFSNAFTNSMRPGYTVNGIGDINGDGLNDIAIADPFEYCVLGQECGYTFVIFGSSTFSDATFDIGNLDGSNGFILTGQNWSQSGMGMSGMDINADGYSDLVIGARSGSLSLDGKIYVLFGKSSPFDALISYASLDGSNGFIIEGDNSVMGDIGQYLTNLGDINDDGIDDLALSNNNNRIYIYYGHTGVFTSPFQIADLDGSNGFTIDETSGITNLKMVYHAGDINDDGINDVLIRTSSSSIYALFGKNTFTSSVMLNDLDGSNGFVLTGFGSNSYDIQGGGDFNGDGIEDFVIGPKIIYGRSSWPATLIPGDLKPGQYYQTTTHSESVSILGDINHDGLSDLLSGKSTYHQYSANSQFNDPGYMYVIFGFAATDVTDPAITCPTNQVVTAGSALLDYTGDAVVSDNCDDAPTVSQSPVAGTIVTGSTDVTLTVTDASGNSSFCTFNVNTTVDLEDPVITCPADQNVDCNTVLVDYTSSATATDNMDTNPVITQSPAVGTTITDGMTITMTATDDAGNTDQCTFVIHINADNTDPVIACPSDQTVILGDVLQDYASTVTVSDNCDSAPVVTQAPSVGSAITDGMFVTLTATDAAGNSKQCSFQINITTDVTSPVITCIPDQNVDCNTVLLDYTSSVIVTDDLDPNPVITQSPAAGSAITAGMTITMTATDDAGNTNQCTFLIDINPDTTKPIMTGVSNQSVDCHETLPDYTTLFTVSDNCDTNPVVTQSPSPGTSVSDGMTVTLTATDVAGNQDDFTFLVTIIADTEAPVLSGVTDQTLDCDDILPDYTATFTLTDNCDASAHVNQSPAAGSPVTSGMTVTLTTEDTNGNTQDFTFGIVSQDLMAPTFTCPTDQVVACGSLIQDYTLISIADNCDPFPTLTQSPAAGSAITADMVITLKGQDATGNETVCTFNLTTVDDQDPSLVCMPTQYVACGSTVIDYSTAIQATDNCSSSLVYTQTPTVGSPVVDGMTLSIQATDEEGNTASCAFQIQVEADNIAPTMDCMDSFEITCGDSLEDLASKIRGTDNCSETVLITQSIPAGTSIIDQTELTLTAVDEAGNSNSCNITIYVSDIEVEAGEDRVISEGQSIQLTALPDQNGSYEWSPNYNLSDPNAANTKASPALTTTYYLHFISDKGCEAGDYVTIEVNEPGYQNGFSPNNDGFNDAWHIKGIEKYPNNTVTIYNRWGNKVFEISGYDNQTRYFDGHANKLQGLGAGLLPEGTYFYHIAIDGENELVKTEGYLIVKK